MKNKHIIRYCKKLTYGENKIISVRVFSPLKAAYNSSSNIADLADAKKSNNVEAVKPICRYTPVQE